MQIIRTLFIIIIDTSGVMASNYKDLCRFCAKNNIFSKDLMDDDNNSILNFVQDVTRITVRKINVPSNVYNVEFGKLLLDDEYKRSCMKLL